MFLVLLFSSSLLALIFYHFYWKRKGLPPGPTPIPIFGNAFSLVGKKPPYEVFLKWQDKYGPIYTYWLGGTPIVAVNEYSLIKDTFIKDGETYTGRNIFEEMMEILMDGYKGGVIGATGELWRDQRRFTLHVLRNFGMGRNLIEDMIMVEVHRLLTSIQEGIDCGNNDQDLTRVIEICIGSIINKLLFGYRFVGDTEQEFYRLKVMQQENVKLLGNPFVQFMMLTSPKILKHFPYFDKLFDVLVENNNKIKTFLDQQIAEHRKKFSVEGEPEEATNYVQAFLMEMNKREKNGDVGDFTILQLRHMCSDLWGAGQETTTTTTNFGTLYLMTHPVVQQKMQLEIDRVVGIDRQVTLSDRPNLPYTNAVCNIFPQPETFEPERFLDENGKLKRIEEFVPFSIGKRQCLGESLAKNELFLFLSNLFHEFKIRPSDPNQTLEKVNGFTAQPPTFKCNAERRIPKIR